MREIKFRGKTLSGKWAYGDLVHFTNTQGIDASVIITEHQATGESDDFDYALCYARNEFKVVIPESVGQFTGLHDKNGKEIYEGDIVRYDMGGECEVSYCIGGGFAGFDLSPAFHNGHQLKDVEVIGNIHDNPELLKTE